MTAKCKCGHPKELHEPSCYVCDECGHEAGTTPDCGYNGNHDIVLCGCMRFEPEADANCICGHPREEYHTPHGCVACMCDSFVEGMTEYCEDCKNPADKLHSWAGMSVVCTDCLRRLKKECEAHD